MYYLIDSELNVIAQGKNFDKLQDRADKDMSGFVVSENEYKSMTA